MRIARWTLGLAAAMACGGGGGEKAGEDAEARMDQVPSGPDPCSLISQAEMEALMGPLAEPP